HRLAQGQRLFGGREGAGDGGGRGRGRAGLGGGRRDQRRAAQQDGERHRAAAAPAGPFFVVHRSRCPRRQSVSNLPLVSRSWMICWSVFIVPIRSTPCSTMVCTSRAAL